MLLSDKNAQAVNQSEYYITHISLINDQCSSELFEFVFTLSYGSGVDFPIFTSYFDVQQVHRFHLRTSQALFRTWQMQQFKSYIIQKL